MHLENYGSWNMYYIAPPLNMILCPRTRSIMFSGYVIGCAVSPSFWQIVLKTLRGLSPRANYTDRATMPVAKLVPTF
jgi:hypothetical protein